MDYSESIAVRLEKGPKYAQFLRKWQRDWFDLRVPPPCPMRGKHVKRKSLYNDEGVLALFSTPPFLIYTSNCSNISRAPQVMLAVREYLNNAMWRANPPGTCEAVKTHLQSQKAFDVMRIDTLLHMDTSKFEISERTAQRWFLRLGWVYGRNKKGYCDGHERKDVVEYRENVFCPRMKVIIVPGPGLSALTS